MTRSHQVYHRDFDEIPLKHKQPENECEIQDESGHELTGLCEYSQTRGINRLPTRLFDLFTRLHDNCL